MRQDSFAWKLYLIFAWLDRAAALLILGLLLEGVIELLTAIVLAVVIFGSNVAIATIWADPEAKKKPNEKPE